VILNSGMEALHFHQWALSSALSIFRTRAGARGRRAIFIQSNARKSARIIIDIINTFIIIVAPIPKHRGIFVRLIIRQVCRPAAPATKSESFNLRARRPDGRSIDAISPPPCFELRS